MAAVEGEETVLALALMLMFVTFARMTSDLVTRCPQGLGPPPPTHASSSLYQPIPPSRVSPSAPPALAFYPVVASG